MFHRKIAEHIIYNNIYISYASSTIPLRLRRGMGLYIFILLSILKE